jgi:hypothetical protein
MQFRQLTRLTAVMGALAALSVFALVGVAIATGVSQEYFEGEHPVPEYTARITAAVSALRLDFAIDNVFILAYGSFFIGLAIVLSRSADARLVNLALAAMLATAVLDMVENHHITAMAEAAVMGIPLSEGEIRLQAVMSLVKFHLSCLGALLLAAAFPRNSTLARWAVGFLLGYAFFGVLILSAPPGWLDLLALVRTVFFVIAFIVTSLALWNFPEPQGEVS